ncbi:MAG: Flp pilus assembly protein CpaB [Blastocatellia bacterium]
MRNKALVFVLIGAVVFGLIAAVSVSRYLSSAATSNGLSTIVIAKVELPLGARVISEQLTTVQFPRNATPDGTFDSLDKVVGRITVTRIAPREPVTSARLAPLGSTGGLSAIIPEGYRAMTVRVDDEVGIAGFVMPGTLVDVLVVIAPPDNSPQGPISKIALQNIKVLASGQDLDQPKNEREPNAVRSVTLQVTPEQAEKLNLGATEGKLRLALRNSIDQGDEQTLGANKRTLLTGERALPVPQSGASKSDQPKPSPPRRQSARVSRPPVTDKLILPVSPTPPPAPPRVSVEIFEGVKKRTVDFPEAPRGKS